MFSLNLHGRRSIELQRLRILGITVNPFQNGSSFSSSFSSASAGDLSSQAGRKGKTFTISYLVDSLGLTSKLAESISNKGIYLDSALNILRSHGFTDLQISAIIRSYPGLLMLDAEKSLGPKLRFLQSRGASSSEFTDILTKVPKILGKKGDKTISLYYDFVKGVIEADKRSSELCHSWPESIKQSNKIRNVLVLRGLGMPQKLLFTLFISNYQPVCGKERFEASLKTVVDKGFDPTTSKFVQALHVVYQTSDKVIEEKVNVYKRLGFDVTDVWDIFKKWPFCLKFSEKKITQTFETLKRCCGLLENEALSVLKKTPQLIRISEQHIANSIETFVGLGFSRDEISVMIKRFPQCLHLSSETLKKKTEFLVKKMSWPLKVVVSNPPVLGYNLEKRTLPRCYVIKTLMSKGLIESEFPSMSSMLAMTDQAFLNRYVRKHDDKELVAELMPIFTKVRKAHLEEE